MIQLIYAKKGSGKTKRLIDMANSELNVTKGDVVFIDDDKRYMYEVKRQVRFVDVKEYGIDSCDSLYGLLCGLVAQNFDIEAIFIDAFLKIINMDVADVEPFIKKLEKLTEEHNFKAIIIISADPKTASEYMSQYIV